MLNLTLCGLRTVYSLIGLLLIGVAWANQPGEVELGISEYSQTDQKHALSITKKESSSTTDHTQLEELQGPFSTGPEVTRACLECHNTAGHQFKKNKHWTWEYKHPKTGQ